MKLAGKNILIVSPEPWGHIFVSKHHYAIELTRRQNKVFFLNPPSMEEGVVQSPHQNLWIVNYSGFAKGLRFFPAVVRRLVVRRVFEKLQKLTGEQIDVIWSFDNSVFYDLDVLSPGMVKISHIVDLNQNFQFARASSTADICLGSTRHIVARQLQYNSRAHFIHHGLNMAAFQKVKKAMLPGQGSFKALYLGNLAMPYIDWGIILEAVRSHPDVDFVFIGSGVDNFDLSINPMHAFKEQICKEQNAFFLAQIESDTIPGYLQAADVLLVAYQKEHHVDQANPHKMMEYLSSGVPIVATYTQEYDTLGTALAMSIENEQWPELFAEVIRDLEIWKGEKRKALRMQYAREHTYPMQIDRIEMLLANLKMEGDDA